MRHRSDAPRVTMLLLDGARPDVFDDLVNAGELPNVSRHILESGGIVPSTTVLPSTTGVAYLPFLTGRYPGTCNVPGTRWMDPTRYRGRWWRDRRHVRSYCGYQGSLLNTDIPASTSSIFDLEPNAAGVCLPFIRGLRSEALLAQCARGIYGSLAHYTGRYRTLERCVGRALVKLAEQRRRFVFAVFPAIDGVAHFCDPWHPEVLALYRDFDRFLGAYAQAGGLDDDHLLLLVSDHGHSPVSRHTDLAATFESRGLRTLRHPVLWRRNPHIAVMVSGNSAAHLYLAPGLARTGRFALDKVEAGEVANIPGDFVAEVAELSGIAFVAGQVDEGVLVVSRNGRARLSEHDRWIRYTPELGDPLELGESATRHERDWLEISYDRTYPDVATQLLQLFRTNRTGDLVVFAAPGYDLRDAWEFPEHRSGHGSAHAAHMRCLLASNVPVAGPIRTVDVFPLVLNHLGISTPQAIDGVLPRRHPAIAA